MTPETFTDLIATIARRIEGKPLDKQLEAELNDSFPPNGPAYREVFEACRAGVAAGWICNREAGAIRFGRVVNPGEATRGFSVDVVEMEDVSGPHHRHPNGEIDLVMPLTPAAKFDGRGAGWLVYGPDSAHSPTVSGGKALVLYLLPQGAIEFTPGQ
ncbi:MAG TPA: DUF4863 family protein [Casimicrobiaceae bacterium]